MTSNKGGMETYLIEQYRCLDRSMISYDFVNITDDRPMVYTQEIEANGDCVYNIVRRSQNPLRHYLEWIMLLKKNKYDAITLNTCSLRYVFPLVIGKLFGIKCRVIHSHNSGNEISTGFLSGLLIKINRILMNWSATDYFACSKTAGEWMFNDKPFKIIHNAINIEKFQFKKSTREKKRKELGLENHFVCGHVGRFSYQKNHKFLLELFYEIKKKRKNAVLVLVGGIDSCDNYYLEQAHEEVKKLNIEDSVIFLGIRNDISELMQAMDLFLFPSHFEGLCLVGIEAQAVGLQSFLSNNITKEIALTKSIHFCKHNDIDDWLNCISNCFNYDHSEDTQNELIKAGYDIHREVNKVMNIYINRLITKNIGE